MPLSLEVLASLATIVAAAVSILALVQSRAWLVLISLLCVCLSVIGGLYARRERLALKAASTIIEGHSIDSLNMANLTRRVNRTFLIQEADHTVWIEGEDMKIEWKYTGYCKTSGAAAMEFSIDADQSTPFEKLDCVAYDLDHDPKMTHEIRPLLVGTEGLSKKISVPFLEPLKADQPFGILLRCTLTGCVKAGFGYYTSTLSFAQRRVRRCVVRLVFCGPVPAWLRVYDCTPSRPTARLVKSLAPSRQEPGRCEYVDVIHGRNGQSARVFAFWRDA